MSYLIWFVVNYIPPISQETIALHSTLAYNWHYPLGSLVDGRMLCQCETKDFEAVRAELEVFNKQVVVVGARYQNGDWLDQYPKNQAEFDKYMQPFETTGLQGEPIMITPADNKTLGWFGFNDVVESQIL